MDVFARLKDPGFWREKILTDLYFLCRCILTTLEDPTPGFKDLYEPTHRRIVNFVEQYAKPGHELLINCPRLWLKSYIITCGWLIQRILRSIIKGKRELWLLANAIETNALELLWRIKYNLEFNEELRFYFQREIPRKPDLEADRWKKEVIEIHGNRIETGAVEKTLESRHYGGGAINDDLVCWANSRTQEQLLKTIDWWKIERPLLLPWAIKINIGTRWDEDDLYGWMLSKFFRLTREEFERLKRQPYAEYHRDKFHYLYISCFKNPEKQKGSTFPTLFPEKELKKIMAEMEDLAGGQFLNDPLSMARGRFRSYWFKYWSEHGIPEEGGIPKIRTTLMTVDWAGSDNKHSDYTGMTVVDAGVDRKLYVRFAERELITDKALAEKIIRKAITYYPLLIGIEEGKFKVLRELMEYMIPDLLRRDDALRLHANYAQRIPYILVELKHHGRPKRVRIDNLTSWVEEARMLFAPHGMEEVRDELLRFPRSSRDDIADALAYILDLLAKVGFPKRSDPVKYLVIPDELKMSKEERERLDWEQYLQDAGEGEPDYESMEDF